MLLLLQVSKKWLPTALNGMCWALSKPTCFFYWTKRVFFKYTQNLNATFLLLIPFYYLGKEVLTYAVFNTFLCRTYSWKMGVKIVLLCRWDSWRFVCALVYVFHIKNTWITSWQEEKCSRDKKDMILQYPLIAHISEEKVKNSLVK